MRPVINYRLASEPETAKQIICGPAAVSRVEHLPEYKKENVKLLPMLADPALFDFEFVACVLHQQLLRTAQTEGGPAMKPFRQWYYDDEELLVLDIENMLMSASDPFTVPAGSGAGN